ncbi:MAG: hypothetical protein ACP6IY_22575 [Promethearchaeia archaeon]
MFEKPCIMAVVGDVNESKSNLLYHLIEELRKEGKFSLYTYGLRKKISYSTTIYSIEELEKIRNSVVIIDEVMSLWDLTNRMAKRQIENTLRLIHHNNNVLVVCGVPENFRKFIASKLDYVFFKRVTISDFVNGSRVKRILTNYKGSELGSSVLNLRRDETILFNGLHYSKLEVPYYPKYDSKKDNPQIIVNKSVNQNVNRKKVKTEKPSSLLNEDKNLNG